MIRKCSRSSDFGLTVVVLRRRLSKPNELMAGDIRIRARRSIMSNRKDNSPFPMNVLAKTTGQFRKNSVARKPGKPPKFYVSNGLNQIHTATEKDVHSLATKSIAGVNSEGRPIAKITRVRYSSHVVGPIRGGNVTGALIRGMTVARKAEFGGTQSRYHRVVPAIRQRGKRNYTWDGSTMRWEFTNTPSKIKDDDKKKKMWYIHYVKHGLIAPNDARMIEMPWIKSSFSQSPRPYMRKAQKQSMAKRRRFLNAAKVKFPVMARRYIKAGGKRKFRVGL